MVLDLDRTDQPRRAGLKPSVNGSRLHFKNLVYDKPQKPPTKCLLLAILSFMSIRIVHRREGEIKDLEELSNVQ